MSAVGKRQVGERIPGRIAEVIEAVELERDGRRFALYRLSNSFRRTRPRIADRRAPRFVGVTSGRVL